MSGRVAMVAGVLVLATSFIAAEEPQPADLNSIRLYVPLPEVEERFGQDIKPLANYIKAMQARAAEILAKEEKRPEAKGLLIAIGIKSKSNTRIWCEAVDGEMPEKLLKVLEEELAKVEAVDLKKSPAGFAMEVNLFGQKPEEFPEFPKVWKEAAEKTESKLLIPPDDLFESIWPDKEPEEEAKPDKDGK